MRTSTALVSGLARRVATTVTTPLVPSDYLDMVAPMRAGGDLRGRVLEVVSETPDAVTVVIRPSRGWAGHLPGQYVRIGVDVDGVRRWRAYSLTSESNRRDVISVTVKAIPDGVVSGFITRSLAPGTNGVVTVDATRRARPETRLVEVLAYVSVGYETVGYGPVRSDLGH